MRVIAICKRCGIVEPYQVSIDCVYVNGKYQELLVTGRCNCGKLLIFKGTKEEKKTTERPIPDLE